MGRLIVLCVSEEQETALHQLFASKAWSFNNLGQFLSEELENELISAWEQYKLNTDSACDDRLDSVQIKPKPKLNQVWEPPRTESEDKIGSTEVKGSFTRKTKKFNQNTTEKKNRKTSLKRNASTTKLLNLRSRSLRSDSKSKENVEDKSNTKMLYKDSECVNEAKNTQFTVCKQKNTKDRTLSYKRSCTKKENNNKNDVDTDHCSSRTVTDKLDKVTENIKVTDDDKSKTGRNRDIEEIDPKLKLIDTKKGFECDKCTYRTNFRSNLNRHVREIHSGVRHKCSICNKTFKGKHDAKMHELYGHNSGLQCKDCDKTFSSVSGLRNHVKIIHKKSSLYTCEHCGMRFYYKSHYLGHINKHLNVKPFSCKTCQKPFRYKVACHLHEKTCCSENYYITHNPDGSLKEAAKSKFLCDICGLELTSKSSLKMHHYYTHSDDTTAVCSLCGKSFKGTYSLQRHMKNAHQDTGVRYTCPECKKEFSQQQIFKQHLKIHQKAYTCFCETCGKGFLSKFKMMEHTRTHTGEKPFSCPHCPSFKSATKTNLQKHMKIHAEGRLPQQQSRKKRKQKIASLKNSHLSSEKVYNQVNCSDFVQSTESCVQPVYVSLQMSSGSYVSRTEYTEGHCEYTDLNQMTQGVQDAHGRRPYNPIYMEQQDLSQQNTQGEGQNSQGEGQNNHGEEGQSNYDLNGCQTENNYEMKHNEHNQHYDVRSQHNDTLQGQGHYEIRRQSDNFYNSDLDQTTEIPQGLNILTVALNIVNPSQF